MIHNVAENPESHNIELVLLLILRHFALVANDFPLDLNSFG